ncbi:MAG: DUF547 domain-containing protein [Cyanothece sp. SIO1E1]|nr:DUF547 domain-containing protein [Cyanothece sp. SIO1E1]
MTTFKPFLTLLPALLMVVGCSTVPSVKAEGRQEIQAQAVSNEAAKPAYDQYAIALKKVDDQGLVNYTELQAKRQPLDAFNSAIAEVKPSTLAEWSPSDQLAFWMNAYNSLTLQSIVDQTPLKSSIKDIPGVWRIRKFDVAGSSKTLNDIEHQTIRAGFDEPRIHVALVCAALSCPQLRNEPFVGERLDEQLDDQTRRFLASPQGLEIDREAGVVRLSKIFDWYKDDWVPSFGVEDDRFAGNPAEKAVLNFVSGYLEPADQEYLVAGNYQIEYLNYDWSLNKQ